MFGGVGLYANDLFFGILASDVLYFKVDDSNRQEYEQGGSRPFKPYAGRAMTMPYYAVPIEIVEDGVRHSVRIGDAIDFEVEDIVPFGVETGQPVRFDGMFHPVASNLTMAEAKRSKIDAFGIQYEGKSGLSTSEFSWAV